MELTGGCDTRAWGLAALSAKRSRETSISGVRSENWRLSNSATSPFATATVLEYEPHGLTLELHFIRSQSGS